MGYLTATPSQVPFVKAFTGGALLALLGFLALGVTSAQGTHAGPSGLIPEGDDDANGSAVCMVTGAAGLADSPVDSVEHDRADDDEASDPANLNDTDGGEFEFTSTTVVCEGEDEGGEVVGTTARDDFTIRAGENSRGGESEYTNKVCGTGHAEGTADLLGGGGNGTNLLSSFSISFVSGIGPLAITGFEGVVDLDQTVPPGAPPLQDIDTGLGEGTVQITPTEGPTDPVTGESVPEPGNTVDRNPPDDDPGDPALGGPTDPPPEPCVNRGVTEFEVAAAFDATLSGDADVFNEDHDLDPAP